MGRVEAGNANDEVEARLEIESRCCRASYFRDVAVLDLVHATLINDERDKFLTKYRTLRQRCCSTSR
jgi:hypothetical protein